MTAARDRAKHAWVDWDAEEIERELAPWPTGLAQGDFFSVGRRYRYVDVWEYTSVGWRQIYGQDGALVLDDRDALGELGAVKARYFRYGRIFRLWSWTGTHWELTQQS